MDIASICRTQIVTIDEQASLREAAALMRSQHVGALVVTTAEDAQLRAVGLVTDRDLAIDVLARELSAADVKVGEIARRSLESVPGSAGIAEAVGVMQRAGVRRLLVTEEGGRITGFISSDDLLDALAVELSLLGAALRAGIQRESVERMPVAAAKHRPVFLPQGTPGWQAAP